MLMLIKRTDGVQMKRCLRTTDGLAEVTIPDAGANHEEEPLKEEPGCGAFTYIWVANFISFVFVCVTSPVW